MSGATFSDKLSGDDVPGDKLLGKSSFPLSDAQRAIWLDEQLTEGTARFHITSAVRLRTDSSLDVFRSALQHVVDNNPMLRASFGDINGEPVQTVADSMLIEFGAVDVAGWSDREIDERLHAEHFRRFDLEHGPPARFCVLSRAPDDHILTIGLHHLVADMWSMALIGQQIAVAVQAIRSGESPPAPGRGGSYREFVRQEREWLATSKATETLEYWRPEFEKWSPQAIPSDRSTSAIGTGAMCAIPLDADDVDQVGRLAARLDVPMRAVLIAAYQTLLHLTTHDDHVIVGEVKANRSVRLARTVGCCINQLPRSARFDSTTTLTEVVQHAHRNISESKPHERISLGRLLHELRPGHGRQPLFEATFAWQKTTRSVDEQLSGALVLGEAAGGSVVGGLSVEPVALSSRSAPSPLALLAVSTHGRLRLAFEYQTERFDGSTVHRLGEQLRSVLRAMVDDVDQPVVEVQLMTDEDRRRQEQTWSAAVRPLADVTTTQLLEAQAASTPHAVAVRHGERTITYRALHEQADRLAHVLISDGVRHGDLVGVCLDRSIDLVVTLLAIWKCGAGYVPMDPDFPADRLAIMVDDASTVAVVSTTTVWNRVRAGTAAAGPESLHHVQPILLDELADELAGTETGRPAVRTTANDLAYVIFTSGSTGRPKGVAIEHRNIVNFVHAMRSRPGFDSGDRVLASTTLSFDIAVNEIFVPLCVGAEVVMVGRDDIIDPFALARALRRVTIAQGTPTMWRSLIASGWEGNGELTVLCGGEPMSRSLADELSTRAAQVWNMYGPTETTVWSATERIGDGHSPIAIGQPTDNTRLYVLDEQRRLTADGLVGELWIGGAGVARGYLGRPDLTAERFVEDPFFGADQRMYRTGDLVRRNAADEIIFVGRADAQVKVRGHRIELGEIEAVLATHSRVAEAVADVQTFGPDDERLVAFYRPAVAATDIGGPTLLADRAQELEPDFRRHLRQHLPDYMVPAHYVMVEAFPLTPNNKIDRTSLPDVSAGRASTGHGRPVAPSDHLVAAILDIYREVLADADVGPDDNFFDLGGHSLLATRIASRVRRVTGSDMAVRSVFEAPSPAALAAVVAADERLEAFDADPHGTVNVPVLHDPAVDATGALTEAFPLSSSQERMWFVNALQPASPAYNLGGAVRVRGAFDCDELCTAFDRVVERHTSLRTVFRATEGEPRAFVGAPFAVDIPVVDLRDTPDGEQQAASDRDIARLAAQSFDLTTLPLFRLLAHRLADDVHIVSIVIHHIIADQWSFGVLVSELAPFLSGAGSLSAPENAVAPRSELYARWQREQLDRHAFDDQLDYWRATLRDLPTIDLVTDRSRPELLSGQGESIQKPLSPALLDAVRATAVRHGASDFMVVFAAFQLLVHRLTGATDIPIGVPIANRHVLESEALITSLVNTLVLRTDLSGVDTFDDLVELVREVTFDAYAHQDVPFEVLVRELAPTRDASRSPLFQLFFNMQNAPLEFPTPDDTDLEVLPVRRGAAQFDIALSVDADVSRTVTLEYAVELFDADRMARLLDDYLTILTEVTHHADAPLGLTQTASSDSNRQSSPADDHTADDGPEPSHGPASTPLPGVESVLAGIWQDALGVADLTRHDNFFDLGGHSILAVRIFADIHRATGRRIPLSSLFQAPTIASLADLLESDGWLTPWTSLVELRRGDSTMPFFYVSPFLISSLSLNELADQLEPDDAFYALQPQGLDTDDPVHETIEEMAAHYIDEIRTVQPNGPYVLGGHCAGGWVAFEMARQLQQAGEHIAKLIVVDIEPPGITPPRPNWFQLIITRVAMYGRNGRLRHAVAWQLRQRWEQRSERRSTRHAATNEQRHIDRIRAVHAAAHRSYDGGTVEGDVTFVRSEEWAGLPDKAWHLDWAHLISGDLEVDIVKGPHARLLDGSGVVALGVVIRRSLAP